MLRAMSSPSSSSSSSSETQKGSRLHYSVPKSNSFPAAQKSLCALTNAYSRTAAGFGRRQAGGRNPAATRCLLSLGEDGDQPNLKGTAAATSVNFAQAQLIQVEIVPFKLIAQS